MATAQDDSMVPERDISFYSNSSSSMDYWLFHQSIAITYFGVGIPVIACVGIVANIFTFSAHQHPDFRCMSTLFLNANLLTDSVLLVACASVVAPKFWLHQFYQNMDYTGHFWRALRAAQTTHIVAYPVFMITKCLSQLYTMALIIEQWIVFARPGKHPKMRSREQGHKMVVLVMNLTIIIHFIVFLKYTRQKVFVWQNGTLPVKVEAEEICLSDVYRSLSYQRYEKYFYFVLFELTPSLVIVLFSVLCFIENHSLNREMLKKNTDISNIKLLRAFRSGRSVSTVLSICMAVFCLQMAAHVTHILSLSDFDPDPLDSNCQLTPIARPFRSGNRRYTIIYTYVNAINAAIKPWICLTFNDDFRHMLASCCLWREKLFTTKANKMAARAFDNRHASFPPPDDSSFEGHDDTCSTTSTNYFDAISYSTVGTPMLMRQDFPISWEYDDTFENDHPQYPVEIELSPMHGSLDDTSTSREHVPKYNTSNYKY